MSVSSLPVATLGTPRIGPRRELKIALESYWSGKSDESALLEAAAGLRAANWARQKSLGVTVIPSNDFTLYDHVLDTSVMVGAIPDIYGWESGPVPLANVGGRAEFLTFSLDGSEHWWNPVSWWKALRPGRAWTSLRPEIRGKAATHE